MFRVTAGQELFLAPQARTLPIYANTGREWGPAAKRSALIWHLPRGALRILFLPSLIEVAYPDVAKEGDQRPTPQASH